MSRKYIFRYGMVRTEFMRRMARVATWHVGRKDLMRTQKIDMVCVYVCWISCDVMEEVVGSARTDRAAFYSLMASIWRQPTPLTCLRIQSIKTYTFPHTYLRPVH